MRWLSRIRELFFKREPQQHSVTTPPKKTQWYRAKVNRIDRKGDIGYAFVYCPELKKPVTFSFSNTHNGSKKSLCAWKQEQPPQTGDWVLIKDIVSTSRGHNAQIVRPEKSTVSKMRK
jgi:hypothetical protein